MEDWIKLSTHKRKLERAYVQWKFLLDMLDCGHASKSGYVSTIQRVQWKLSLDTNCIQKNLMLRLSSNDSNCVLCGHVVVSRIHLFLKRPAARAIWRASIWGIRFDSSQDGCGFSQPCIPLESKCLCVLSI